MKDYTWAQNKLKLARVVGENPEGTEEQHKEAYKALLGVVLEEEVKVVEEKPKKSKKK